MAFEDSFNEVNQDLPPCLLQKEIQDLKSNHQTNPISSLLPKLSNGLKMHTSVLERSGTWTHYQRLPVREAWQEREAGGGGHTGSAGGSWARLQPGAMQGDCAGGNAVGHRRAWGHRLSEPLSVLPAMPPPVPCLLQRAGDSCSLNATSVFSGACFPLRICPRLRRASTPSFGRMSLGKLFCSFLNRGSRTPTGFSGF